MSVCFDKICRTCMAESPTMLSIFDSQEGPETDSSITTMLRSFTTITACKDDGLPENVCITCLSEINRAVSFKQKCERSEYTLKSYLHQISIIQSPVNEIDEIPIVLSVNEHHNMKDDSKPQITLPDLGEITHFLKNNDDALGVNNTNSVGIGIEKTTIIINENIEENHEENTYLLNTEDQNKETTNILYQCHICCTTFQYSNELEEHMAVDHIKSDDLNKKYQQNDGPPPIIEKIMHKCATCAIEFVHKTNLNKHIIKYHPVVEENNTENAEEDIEEKIVDYSDTIDTDTIDADTIDADTIDDGMVYIDYTENKELVTEIREEPSVEIQSEHNCNKCGASFAVQKSLNIHQKSNKCTEKSFMCSICSRVFVRKKNLNVHMLTHSTKKEFSCHQCTKQYSRHDQLLLHLQNHSPMRKHQCPFCPKGFNMISTLKDHIRTHNGERPFLCSICGKGFSQSTNLKQHVMRHNKTKPYKCTTCTYSFVSKGELEAHLRKHTGDHPFVCDICGTGFTTSSSLVKHKRIHTGERPYACEFCPMRFTALGTLKNHRRTHTGERPFACKFCSRTFTQRSDCVSHQRTHTGERPYFCEQCNKSFLQHGTLKAHMKTHLNDQSVSTSSANDLKNVSGVIKTEDVVEIKF